MKSMRGKKKPPGLMLTSLLDMFTIILIFLIVSFEAEEHEFALNEKLTLPESSARSAFKPAVNIAITSQGVEVDKKLVVKMAPGGRFDPQMYADQVIEPLKDVLVRRYELLKLEAEYEGSTIDERAIIIVQADRDMDYDTIYLVLRTAAQADFFKYRLAIMKK